MLEQIVEWGKKEKAIKALILLGSRAARNPVDSYSDYDIAVFCDGNESYIESEKWLSQFGQVLVCVKEKVINKGQTFPTRLVIYEGGIKVDFSFFPIQILNEIASSNPLPDQYNLGYQVLLDKENRTTKMLSPQFKLKPVKPTEKEFCRIIEEFWFEIYHVAIYLKRGDLWSVKFRFWSASSFLLQMIEWHIQAKQHWQFIPPPNGKRMLLWIDKDVWQDLHGVFAHFDATDSGKALSKMVELFRRLTAETAEDLAFDCKEELSKKMIHFITSLVNSY